MGHGLPGAYGTYLRLRDVHMGGVRALHKEHLCFIPVNAIDAFSYFVNGAIRGAVVVKHFLWTSGASRILPIGLVRFAIRPKEDDVAAADAHPRARTCMSRTTTVHRQRDRSTERLEYQRIYMACNPEMNCPSQPYQDVRCQRNQARLWLSPSAQPGSIASESLQ
jgi:hypothetical protein